MSSLGFVLGDGNGDNDGDDDGAGFLSSVTGGTYSAPNANASSGNRRTSSTPVHGKRALTEEERTKLEHQWEKFDSGVQYTTDDEDDESPDAHEDQEGGDAKSRSKMLVTNKVKLATYSRNILDLPKSPYIPWHFRNAHSSNTYVCTPVKSFERPFLHAFTNYTLLFGNTLDGDQKSKKENLRNTYPVRVELKNLVNDTLLPFAIRLSTERTVVKSDGSSVKMSVPFGNATYYLPTCAGMQVAHGIIHPGEHSDTTVLYNSSDQIGHRWGYKYKNITGDRESLVGNDNVLPKPLGKKSIVRIASPVGEHILACGKMRAWPAPELPTTDEHEGYIVVHTWVADAAVLEVMDIFSRDLPIVDMSTVRLEFAPITGSAKHGAIRDELVNLAVKSRSGTSNGGNAFREMGMPANPSLSFEMSFQFLVKSDSVVEDEDEYEEEASNGDGNEDFYKKAD